MQLGPDGKLYIGRCYSDTIDVIHNPDVAGPGCMYQKKYLALGDTNAFVVAGFIQIPPYLTRKPRISGCAPLQVSFPNPNPSALWYDWRFLSDSTFSTSATPSKTFTQGGEYGVILRVGLPNGGIDSSYFTVRVFDKPSIQYRYVSDTVCLGQDSHFFLDTLGSKHLRFQVFLDGQNIQPDSNWHFHRRLSTPGQHTVRVISTQVFSGCRDTVEYPLWVHALPDATFQVSDTLLCAPGRVMVRLSGSDSARLYSRALGWRLPPSVGSNRLDTLVYPQATRDSLRVIRINAVGCRDTSAARQVRILPKPKAQFSMLDTLACGFVYVGIRDSSQHVYQGTGGYMEWEFGDGTPSVRSFQPNSGFFYHSFQQSGNFTIRAIANNGVCADTLVSPRTITITPAPQPGIGSDLDPDTTVVNGIVIRNIRQCAPYTVQLTDLSSGSRDSVRFFLDGQVLNGMQVAVSSSGVHWVLQKVYGPTGCVTTDTLHLEGLPRARALGLVVDSLPSCGRVRLRVQGGSITGADSVQLRWNIPGTGVQLSAWQSPNQPLPDGWVNQSGTVEWQLRMRAGACEDSVSQAFTQYVRPRTQALLKANDSLYCLGRQVFFQNLSTEWDSLRLGVLSPGSMSTTYQSITSASQPLNSAGNWTFSLVAQSKEGCSDTSSLRVRVLPDFQYSYSYTDTAECGRMRRYVRITSGDSIRLFSSLSEVFPSSAGVWTFALRGTDSLRLRLHLQNARCDTNVYLSLPYQVRPVPEVRILTDSLASCVPFSLQAYIGLREVDSLYWRSSQGWARIFPLPDSSVRPYNWQTTLSQPYSGPVYLRWISREGCRGDTLLGRLNLKARPQFSAVVFPNEGCSPLATVLRLNYQGGDSLYWRARNAGGVFSVQGSGLIRQPISFTQSDTVFVRMDNGLCGMDTSLFVVVGGFRNTAGLQMLASRADSVSGQEHVRLFWRGESAAVWYKVERSMDSLLWEQAGISVDSVWMDWTGSVDQAWWYRVTAMDSCGNALYAVRPLRHLALGSGWSYPDRRVLRLVSEGDENRAGVRLHSQGIGFSGLLFSDSMNVLSPVVVEERTWPVGEGDLLELSLLRHWLSSDEGGFWRRSNTRVDTVASALYLATAFTPNGDGVNDVLHPKGVGLTDIRMEVWDRWGRRVYIGSGTDAAWDGSAGGERLAEGMYVDA